MTCAPAEIEKTRGWRQPAIAMGSRAVPPVKLPSAGAVSTGAAGITERRMRTRLSGGVGAGNTIFPTTRIGYCILTLSVPPSR